MDIFMLSSYAAILHYTAKTCFLLTLLHHYLNSF